MLSVNKKNCKNDIEPFPSDVTSLTVFEENPQEITWIQQIHTNKIQVNNFFLNKINISLRLILRHI